MSHTYVLFLFKSPAAQLRRDSYEHRLFVPIYIHPGRYFIFIIHGSKFL